MDRTLNLLKASNIKNITANKRNKSIKIDIVCNTYINLLDEQNILKFLRDKFNTNQIELTISFDEVNFDQVVMEDIKERIIFQIPLLLPFKEDILIKNESNECIIEIPAMAKHLFEEASINKMIGNYIKKINKNIINIEVNLVESSTHQHAVEEIKNELKEQVKKQSKIANYVKKTDKDFKVKKRDTIISLPSTPIIKITSNDRKVAITGKIINNEITITKNKYEIITFDVTDYTSTMTCKCFLSKKNKKEIAELVFLNNYVTVEGDYGFDSFSRENLITLKKIEQADEVLRMDESKAKRVELHLHTKMSSLDAFITPKKLFSELERFGHTHVAITDHGVLQSYPEVQELSKKHGINPIYGVEGYLVDDGLTCVYNPSDHSLNRSYAAIYFQNQQIDTLLITAGKATDKKKFNMNQLSLLLDFIDDNLVVLLYEDDCNTLKNIFKKAFIEVVDLNNVLLTLHNKSLSKELLKNEYSIDYMYDSATTFILYEKFNQFLVRKEVITGNQLSIYLSLLSDQSNLTRYHVIILAKNQRGLKSLYELVSYSHLNFFYKKPIIPKSLLDGKREGLLIGSACEAGQLYRAIVEKKDDNKLRSIASFYDYLEIQPVGNNEFMVRNEIVKNINDIKTLNIKVVTLGDELDIPVVATCDAHFFDKRDSIFREIIMKGQGYNDASNQPPLYYRTTEEMLAEFTYLDSDTCYKVVVENTNLIANMIKPLKPIPDGTFPPIIEGSDDILRESSTKKAIEIYGKVLPEKVEKRMNKELDSIITNGFSVMYIIAQKLVTKSLSDGYLVGSRGSVGSSFVAFLAGITEVNSLMAHYICPNCLKTEFSDNDNIDCGVDLPDRNCSSCGTAMRKDGYDIPFETFLGFYGDKEPDIDLNFSGDYQSKAHKYVEEIFGEDNVFRAGTISTVKEKTAYGFVKGYLDEGEIFASRAEVNRLINGCAGVKKTTGQHPGGIMVMPKGYSIHQFTPIQHPADSKKTSIITTHFDFNSLHGRLLKLDILGHDDPTMLKKLHNLTGINPIDINIVDKKILSLFVSNEVLDIKGETTTELGVLGIPEFGTKFVREMLTNTKPSTFSELVKISGLSHGTDVWNNNAEELIKNHTATLHEVICTRDDIMLYLIHKGMENKIAFDVMEKVRKGNGITNEEEKIMKSLNVPKWYIESCKKIKYMFPKAHAVAYVVMALRIAWYKIYKPLEYYVAYLSIRATEFDCEIMGKGPGYAKSQLKQMSNKDKKLNAREKNISTIIEIVIEMYARGYEFLPVDLYKSHSNQFLIENNKLRMPFSSVAGLGVNAAKSIVEDRTKGQYTSADELRHRTSLSTTQVETLKSLKALGDIPNESQISFFN